MALNCKLDRNISVSQQGDGGSDSCNSQDITVGVGGISSPILVYNISDVPSLTFEGDNRSDYSLFVETINSTGQFYKVDHTSATYNEEYDNHKWTHNLEISVANIQPLFEDILSDATNGRYLVCWRPNGGEDYRMFGWKYGATLDYSMNVTDDSHGYTITFNDESEYPLFTVDRDNFGSKTKTYSPIWKPLYDVYYCEQDSGGRHTGYIVAMYVVKTNAAGQPLDTNNRLCQWSNLKQDAYKVAGISSDGGYNIVGTYQKNATFDGKAVRIYDLEKCPANVTNSIFINSKKAETINLNSTITASTYTITSSDEWSMVSDPQYVTISPVEGVNGNTQCSVHHNGVGGIDTIEFQNKVTHEIVTLTVNVNLLKIAPTYTYPVGTTDAVITPVVEGCNTAYTYTITPSVTSYMDELGYIHITFPDTESDLQYTLTTVHGCDSNERKVSTIFRKGLGRDPKWIITNNFCEIVNGLYTGYRMYQKTDVNPNSPTYGHSDWTKERDATCNEASPNWTQTAAYCEVDVQGSNTGYHTVVLSDVNTKSPTYGQTRTETTQNTTLCPIADKNPKWIPDEKFEGYCEQMYYEPAHVEANSGYYIGREIDDNRLSPTYRQTRDTRVLSPECPPPDTTPSIEEVSYSCVLDEDSEGNLLLTGECDITGLDTNVFSATYLQVTTSRIIDTVRCTPNTPTPPEPEACTAFIIDGGSIDADADGDSGCDSAFLWAEGTPVFTPSSASNWISIQYYYWDEDPSSTMCTNYASYPCVANNLMYQAGLVDEEVECATASHNLSDYPQVVQDAVNKTGKYGHALGTMRYVIDANSDDETRYAEVSFIVDSEECPSRTMYITQEGQGGGSCDCASFSAKTASATVPATMDDVYYLVGHYTGATDCTSSIYENGLKSGSDFLKDFDFENGNIYAKVKERNTSSGTRTAQYWVKQADCEDYFTVSQAGGATPVSDAFEWDISGHKTSYTADTAPWNNATINLSSFTSVKDGADTNATTSASKNWIHVDSELTPNTGHLVMLDNNTDTDPREGSITLTQKGTSNKITVTIKQNGYSNNCGITSFSLDSEVCIGSSLNYSFTTLGSCSQEFNFTLYDKNWHSVTSKTTARSGSFDTTGLDAGTGRCDVVIGTTVTTFNTTLKDCSVTYKVNFKITNSTGAEMYVDAIDFVGASQSYSVSVPSTKISNGSTKTFSDVTVNSSDIGKSYNSIQVRDTVVSHRGYTTNASSGTITDGSTYSFSVTSSRSVLLTESEEEETENNEDNKSEETER